MLMLGISQSGCALLPRYAAPTALDEIQYLTIALEADPGAREALWKTAGTAGKSDEAELRVALLQSVPGHSGYDPVAAHDSLERIAARPAAPEAITTVARLRLAQVDQDAAMAAEITQLKQRLARVVEIEKRMNGKERGK